MITLVRTVIAILLILLPISSPWAGIVIGGTRVVFNGEKKEASLSTKNPDDKPFLIQSWVESYSGNDKPPFVITPPLFRLDQGKENILRIVRAGGNLPEDRESVFWLNIKSIPSSEQLSTNQLQITVKARIKLFYRPTTLNSIANATNAYKKLTFSRATGQVVVRNPTPYYVSFYHIDIDGKKINEPEMVPPLGSLSISATTSSNSKVSWQAINDYGGITPMQSFLF